MPLERIYERYVSESPTEVVVENKSSRRTLQRCRMYNSHLDTKGFLYTDYQDTEYKQYYSDKQGSKEHRVSQARRIKEGISKLTTEQRAETAKRGWETRRSRGN